MGVSILVRWHLYIWIVMITICNVTLDKNTFILTFIIARRDKFSCERSISVIQKSKIDGRYISSFGTNALQEAYLHLTRAFIVLMDWVAYDYDVRLSWLRRMNPGTMHPIIPYKAFFRQCCYCQSAYCAILDYTVIVSSHSHKFWQMIYYHHIELQNTISIEYNAIMLQHVHRC